MAAPVWVLSVDLQTKTATFQSGMADAARTARGTFNDIKTGSNEMGRAVGTNMFEARHGVILLGEEFGVRLPRALTAFITSIGPIGAAMEAAFPFLAIAVGATLLIDALASMHEKGVKLTEDQTKFGTAVQDAFNQLDARLLQAQIKADEFRNDHLGALAKQLQLIDKQSMAELIRTFGEVAKAADVVFADLKNHWYTFSGGSDGAKQALDEFHVKYAALLAEGKDKEASDLLRGTRESAEKVLKLQQESAAVPTKAAGGGVSSAALEQDYARIALRKEGIGYGEKDLAAQQAIVEALQKQTEIEGKITELKKLDSANATRTTAGEMSAQQSAQARAAAESVMRIQEAGVQADRATANAKLAITRASIAERTASEVAFADREYAIQQAANAATIAALDKLNKEYPNQLKAMHEKAEELTAQHAAKLAEITAKGATEQAAKDLSDFEQGQRELIEAQDQGSAERLAVVNAAILAEQAKHLEDTSFYRELLIQRVEIGRKAAEEERKQAAETGRLIADQAEKMGALQLAAEKEQQALRDSSHRLSAAQRLQEEVEFINQEYALKLMAASQELAALDKSSKDYQNKLREVQNKELQLVQEHENAVAQAKSASTIEANNKVMAAASAFNNQLMSGLTQVLMGHKSFASEMNSLGNQVVSGMMENALKTIEANLIGKESDAAKAARAAYNIGLSYGGPAGIVLGPAFAAVAFSSMMAFSGGTDGVPGVGRGDTVPAMLTPGEGVVPGGVMDGLRNMVRSGGMGGNTTHIRAHFAPTVHALDAGGVDKVLEKHGDKFQKHIENAVRKMNK